MDRNGWLPIDTAPRDGTRILLQLKRRVVCGHWDTDAYAKKPRPFWTNDTEVIWGKTGTRADQPTHWQPLPAPPEADTGHQNHWTEADAAKANDVAQRRCIHEVPINVYCSRCEP